MEQHSNLTDTFQKIYQAIVDDPANRQFTQQGIKPLYYAGAQARILLVAQAPGQRAQQQGMFWNDPSGVRLRDWLGLSWDEFYHSGKVAIMPMDFYFPGNSPHGDLPPRPDFAAKWHPQLLDLMPNIQLTILIGAYASRAYLHLDKKTPLTKIVRHYQDYLPQYFPIVHPSPRNRIWMSRNPWFEKTVLPDLQKRVSAIMETD